MPGLLLSFSYDPADLLNVLQQKLYNVGVLDAMRCLLLKDIYYVLCLHTLAIRAILGQRRKYVGNGHNLDCILCAKAWKNAAVLFTFDEGLKKIRER